MIIIIPAAGKSSRFSNVKPKPFLTNPNGNLMLLDCIMGLDLVNVEKIIVTLLKEHIQKYCQNDISYIKRAMNKINIPVEICILDEPTSSQCETIKQTIIKCNIKTSILIKDVDNKFVIQDFNTETNGVCFLNLNENKDIKNLCGKSYIEMKNNKIINIVEKKIISDEFCVGGYFFKNSLDYLNTYSKIKNNFRREIFTSDIIYDLILNQNKTFFGFKVINYLDWGTYEDWISYKESFKTIFCDIDGVLFENCGEFTNPSWGFANPIIQNIEHIKKLQDTQNIQLILTTARKEKYREVTITQLEKYNVQYNQLVMNLFHCKRFLINDFSTTNPFPSSVSINLKRNDTILNQML